ncbi:lanthionine synthetase LanC family protein [Actinospica robiniae]|uniref:class III lanthionine synthetase LanKC N-terminal domain-containing protein n=1 Tax=Actinospica robiniae TaxID=304901 RepID=UPI0004134B29|nr:lanthionine synthetase LanC family protein [Actinospica robiniae]
MAEVDFEGRVRHLLQQCPGSPHNLRGNETWLYLHHPDLGLPPHGWKLHVSTRAATFADLVDRLIPVLLEERCSFKLARSAEVLTRLNNGHSSPATVGKAVTVYPPQDRVRELGLRLADLLGGWAGPRVLSDRAVAADAPVYYRYGPFTRQWGADERARLVTVIHGPDARDEEFGGLATMRYRQPSWTVDPFRQGPDPVAATPGFAAFAVESDGMAPESEAEVLGGRFRLIEGVLESGRGNIYRAVDERDGASVIVKQARALVDETEAAGDVRLRVRNERRVLQVLAGLDGVAGFVDHFRHGPDEFLVTVDAGRYNLAQDVTLNGRYAPVRSAAAARGARPLELLAQRLARILLAVHERGVIMRDLTPRNIVVAGESITLIDFGLASYQDLHLPGGTPGYAPARQRRGEEPSESDDFFGLGMTLLYAESSLSPSTLGEDLELPAHRALQYLRRRYGEAPAGVMGAIEDLLSLDERAHAAARRLAAGVVGDQTAPQTTTGAALDPLLPAHIRESLLTDLLEQSHRSITGPSSRSITHDASIYSGAAGAGLELLHHLDRPGVREHVGELARFAVRVADEMRLPHGYLSGRTGVDVFLAHAAAAGIDVGDAYAGPVLPGEEWKPVGADLMIGAAGVGIGHLVLSDLGSGGADHLEVARWCAQAICDGSAAGRNEHDDLLPAQAAVETSTGRAHGLAGTVEFLLYYAERTHDDEILGQSREWANLLRARAESLLDRLPTPYAAPIAVSWCQGMAGINQTLLHAADVFDDPEFGLLAGRIADACVAFLPHVSVIAQCCGLAGVGNTLIDVALAEQGVQGGEGGRAGRYWDGADEAAAFLLLRGAGTPTHPVLMVDRPEDGCASWAFGNAGVLAFFRRLAERGGPWSLPMPMPIPVRANGDGGRG